ncbi:AraC family transcriptional regulator ligand-binding domain-containing protein [Micromonospora sp. NPDC048930]|uniref:AraC family transcriptional regulator ligand-binding domain-containing protein n=1 Tax=Micromonospora sp. NPDC048930 TaxID=3364261 RepID=UPI00371CF794
MSDVRVSAEAPRMLLHSLARLGADPMRLAREVGLDLSQLKVPGWVSAERVYALWGRSERLLDDPLVGAHVGFGHEVGMLGLQDSLYLTSDTLGEAIEVTLRHLASLSRVGGATLIDNGSLVTLTTHVPPDHAAMTSLQSASFGVAYQIAMAQRATGTRVTPYSVGFMQPAPRWHRPLADALGVEEIRFGEPTNTVTFRKADLATRILSADPVLAAVLRRHATGRIQTFPAVDEQTAALESVRRWLPRALADGEVSLTAAAKHMHVSARTLQQRLRSAGTTWRTEVDAARAALAAELLGDSAMPIASIAARLGYSDVRAFRRAFHRRHGSSPTEYRRAAS